MQIKEYFTVQFKKPILADDEKTREEKKKTLEAKLEKAYSRLESIEILNSNSKSDDMFILSSYLVVDLYNLSADYHGVETVETAEGLADKVDNLPDDALRTLYKDQGKLLSVHTLGKPTEEDAEVLEEQAGKLLMGLEKHFKKLRKTELHTPLDDFKKRWKIQAGVVIGFLVLTVGGVIQNQLKYPVMKDDTAQLYFMSKETPNPTDANSVKIPVEASQAPQWQEYNFSLPEAKELVGVRVDPINQRKVRFNISHVKYLDSTGKVLFERDFQLGDNLIPKDIEQIGMLNDIKAGKAAPGAFAEMVSIGSDPFFHLELPPTKNVASVQVRMRMIEEYKKFED